MLSWMYAVFFYVRGFAKALVARVAGLGQLSGAIAANEQRGWPDVGSECLFVEKGFVVSGRKKRLDPSAHHPTQHTNKVKRHTEFDLFFPVDESASDAENLSKMFQQHTFSKESKGPMCNIQLIGLQDKQSLRHLQ